MVGSVSRIMTRHCSMSSARAPYWDAILALDQYTKNEIIFWKENIDFVKSRFCFLDRKPRMFGFSDASASGCGAVIPLDSQDVCHKLWDSSDASKSSTRRELAAIDFARLCSGRWLPCSHARQEHKFPFGIEIFSWASCRHQV